MHVLALLFVSLAPLPSQNVPIVDNDGDVVCSSVLLDPQTDLTAAHCIDEPATTAMVQCMGSNIGARVIKIDRAQDLAVLELAEPCAQRVSMVATANPLRGADVYALGCPARHCGRITKGVVSSYEPLADRIVLVTDTQIYFGNSGGGLFDDKGRLVGIASMVERFSPDGEHFEVLYGAFIPIESALKFLAE